MTQKMNGLICLAACLTAPLSPLVANAGTTAPLPAAAPVSVAPQQAAPTAAMPVKTLSAALDAFDRSQGPSEDMARVLTARPGAAADMPQDPCELFSESPATIETAVRMGEEVEAWTRWLASWGAERATLYGVPGDADLAMSRRGARSIAWLSMRALAILGPAIDAHDRAGGQSDAQLVLEAVNQRETHLPLRAGRALVLMAALTGDDALRRSLAEQAQLMVEGAPTSSTWSEVEHSLVLALSWLVRGETDDAVKSLVAAEKVMSAPESPVAIRRAMGDEIALGSVMATLRAQGPAMALNVLQKVRERMPFVENGLRDPHLALLAAGTELRLARAEAASKTSEPARLEIMERAYTSFANLAERTDTGLSPVDMRRLVYAGLGSIVPSDAPFGVLPPIVSIARARCLAEMGQTAEALALLDPLLRRTSDELGSTETDAMWLSAALLAGNNTTDDRRKAADIFLRLAQEFPTDPQAAQAVEAACSSAFRLHEDTASAEPSVRDRSRTYLIECLRVAHTCEADVPRRNDWRVELCRQLTAEPSVMDARLALRRMDEAASVASAISVDSIDRATAAYVIATGWSTLLELATRRPDAFAAADLEQVDVAESQLEAAESARSFIENALRTPAGQSDDSLHQALRSTTAFAGEALLILNRSSDGWALMSSLPGISPANETNARVARAAVHLLIDLGGMSEARQWMDRLCDISPEWARWTLAEMSDRAWNQIEPDVLGFPADTTLDAGRDAAIPVLRLVEEMAHCRSLAEVDTYRKRLAWALVLGGDADQATVMFEDMMRGSGRQIDLLRGLGEAKLANADDAGAFTVFREIAGLLEAQPHKDRNYWHAWTRMLQILGRQNADGSRTQTIIREARRLKTLGDDSSSQTYLQQIEKVASALDAE